MAKGDEFDRRVNQILLWSSLGPLGSCEDLGVLAAAFCEYYLGRLGHIEECPDCSTEPELVTQLRGMLDHHLIMLTTIRDAGTYAKAKEAIAALPTDLLHTTTSATKH